MKMKSLAVLVTLSLGAISNSVLASGTHAGGHGDDAIGVPGKLAKTTRTVAVDMTDDMRFTPASIAVTQGETIRFKVRNSGKLKHELVLGTARELKQHYAAMMKHPEMEHADPNMITLAPGASGEVIWQFTQSGKVDFGCLQPGHYDAGMKGQVSVAARKTPGKEDTHTTAHSHMDHGNVSDAKVAQAAASDMTDGEVRKIDKGAKKITIRHGEMKNLGMPAMSMVFQVKDPTLLDQVKPGDKVRFRAEKSGGAFVVTEIQADK